MSWCWSHACYNRMYLNELARVMGFIAITAIFKNAVDLLLWYSHFVLKKRWDAPFADFSWVFGVWSMKWLNQILGCSKEMVAICSIITTYNTKPKKLSEHWLTWPEPIVLQITKEEQKLVMIFYDSVWTNIDGLLNELLWAFRSLQTLGSVFISSCCTTTIHGPKAFTCWIPCFNVAM